MENMGNGLLDTDRCKLAHFREHNSATMLLFRWPGYTIWTIVAQRVHIDFMKANLIVWLAIQDDCSSCITQSQAGQTGIHIIINFLLCGMGEMGNVLTTGHHATPNQPGFDKSINYVDPGEHTGAGISDIKNESI